MANTLPLFPLYLIFTLHYCCLQEGGAEKEQDDKEFVFVYISFVRLMETGGEGGGVWGEGRCTDL